MPNFQWLTYLQARQLLAGRLADPGMVFWTDAELGTWIIEALRTWNALTEFWNTDYAFQATDAEVWYDLAIMAGSPRIRTVVDTDIYTAMEYHLLEPPTGSVWTGTSQFSISDLQGALQRRRDEIIQVTGCNIKQLPIIPNFPNTRRVYFDDSTLEPRRARFVPDSTYGNAVTMSREDTIAWDGFESQHLQQWEFPAAWSVITGPPLAMDVDTAPNVPGGYDVITLQAGLEFGRRSDVPLGIPDDWSWLAKWGALGDLLGRDSEATDRPRSDYCMKRYQQGLEIMKASNWLVSGTINGIPVDAPSVKEMDGFSPEWEDDTTAWPSLVQAGMDFIAPCPVANPLLGISLILIGNAPIPVNDSDYIQVSRDVMDVILDYAQRLASFKMGGMEFFDTEDLEKNFFNFALKTNKRLSQMGIFADVVHSEGKRQDLNQPR